MKMAKATGKDIEAAGELLGILDTIDGRFGGPWPTDGPESLEQAVGENAFDADNRAHLQGLYNSLAKLLRGAPNFHGRVIGGMCYVILYDKNQIVDPDADCLELHPKLTAAMKDAERYRWLRAQHWSDNTISAVRRPKDAMKMGHDAPSGDRLDALIDEAMAVPADGKLCG